MSKTRTYRYLYPCIHFGYGDNFQKLMSGLMKKSPGLIHNMYIADVDQPDIPFGVFVLFDKSKALNFLEFLKFIEKEEAFVYDYQVDTNYHMIVLKVPDEFLNAYENFRNSKYSKMYSAEFVSKNLNNPSTEQTYSVLAKTEKRKKYLQELVGQLELADEYDSILGPEETFDKTELYDNKQTSNDSQD